MLRVRVCRSTVPTSCRGCPRATAVSQVQSRATTCGDNWVCGPVLGWCQVGFPKQVGEVDRRRGPDSEEG